MKETCSAGLPAPLPSRSRPLTTPQEASGTSGAAPLPSSHVRIYDHHRREPRRGLRLPHHRRDRRGHERAAERDRLPPRPLQGDGRRRARHVRRAGRAHRHRTSATCASGWPARAPAATSSTTPRPRRYRLPAEHAAVLADEDSPVYQGGMFQSASAAMLAQDHVAERFVTGDGLGWHEHHHDLFDGTARCSASPTRPCWCRSGSRRSTASRPSSGAARWWPTSAAATGSRRS